jgi:hypothetical protein
LFTARWLTSPKRMVKYASTAPYMNGIFTSFFSSKMSLACDVFDDLIDDLAQFCLK